MCTEARDLLCCLTERTRTLSEIIEIIEGLRGRVRGEGQGQGEGEGGR